MNLVRLPRRRSRPFVDRPGQCSVCGLELIVRNLDDVALRGWTAHGEQCLCARCRRQGWELSNEGVPHRPRRDTESVPPEPQSAAPLGTDGAATAGMQAGTRSRQPIEVAPYRRTRSRWRRPFAAGTARLRALREKSLWRPAIPWGALREKSLWRPAIPWGGLAVLAVVLLAAGAGLLVGGAGTESDGEARRVTAERVRLTVPSSWQRLPAAIRVPGLALSDELALGPRRRAGEALVVGEVRAAGRGEPRRPAERRLIELGGWVAWEQRDRGSVVYRIPVQRRDLVIACVARAGGGNRFLQECERVSSTLALSGADGLSADAATSSIAALGRSIGQLGAERRRGRSRLRRARTGGGQAAAASALARSYRAAARRLAAPPAAPASRRLYPDVLEALGPAQRAYGALARSAPRGRRARFAAARRRVADAEGALRRALEETRRDLGRSTAI